VDRPALSGRDDGPTYAGEVARISGPGERRPEQHGPAPVVGPAARQLQLERRTCGARLSKLRRGRRPAPAMKRCQGVQAVHLSLSRNQVRLLRYI
jgi:hypothetical protein